MTPLAEIFPREHGRDLSHVFQQITMAIELANLDAVCHGLTTREVLSVWAKGETVNDTNACVAQMARLGRA